MASTFPPPPKPLPTRPPFEPRVVAAGEGGAWWVEGWRIFKSRAGTWIGLVIVYFVISMLVGKVPYVGGVAEWLLTPVFIGGIMLGCDALRRGESLRIGHLFDGFKGEHFTPLLQIALCNLALTLLAGIIALVVIVATYGMAGTINFGTLADDPLTMVREFGAASFLLFVLALIVVGVIAMANWFAPALIVLSGATPVSAMVLSFRSCMRNWAPFLLYGVIGIGITIALTCAIGLLVGVVGAGSFVAILQGGGSWETMFFALAAFVILCLAFAVVITPVIFGSTYAGYRDTLVAVEGDSPART
jgi:hypothetical protein